MKILVKKVSFLILSLIMVIVSVCLVSPANALADTDYSVGGYAETFEFNLDTDIKNYSVTGEHGDVPFINDGMLILPNTGFMYGAKNDKSYSGDIEVVTKVVRLADQQYPHINAGIAVRSDATGKNNWTVNMGCNYGSSTVNFSISQVVNNGLTPKASAAIAVAKDFTLKIVVKSDVLYVFIDNASSPAVSYNIGSGSGCIGFRGYYSATAFDYITVKSASITAKPTTYNYVLYEAKKIDQNKLTALSKSTLSSAITLLENANNQIDLDNAGKNLEKVMSEIIYKRSQNDLDTLLAIAGTISNPDGKVYTANSYKSFLRVLDICQNLNTTNEDEFSYYVNCLEEKIANLVRYIGG